ncbi:hypothetical protein Tco_1505613 [Tanacetum coccineum]
MTSDIMKITNTKDLRRGAEQLKYTPPDEMVKICAEMGSATPEELASMRSRAGLLFDLMSCYIKTNKFDECIQVGTKVPWTNERPFENRELNGIIDGWFTLWRD